MCEDNEWDEKKNNNKKWYVDSGKKTTYPGVVVFTGMYVFFAVYTYNATNS